MSHPQFVEEHPLTLADVKDILNKVEKRDTELNLISNKAKEYLDAFVSLSAAKKKDLHAKLVGLDLVRLKEEHIAKIIDFLPTDANELKTVLQAYPLSLPKKDQDVILGAVKDFL